MSVIEPGDPRRAVIDPLCEFCPHCGRGTDLTWTNFVRLLEYEREDVLDELAFEAALHGDVIASDMARAVYASLAPRGPRR